MMEPWLPLLPAILPRLHLAGPQVDRLIDFFFDFFCSPGIVACSLSSGEASYNVSARGSAVNVVVLLNASILHVMKASKCQHIMATLAKSREKKGKKMLDTRNP
jgi:hypothetical protein